MKLLFVDSCISQRREGSRTRALAEAFLDAFRAGHPDWEAETVDVGALGLPPFTPELLDRRDALAGVGAFDAPVFDLARQFRGADGVVVAAPFWDLSYPAALRIYMEYLSANGVAYHYDQDGCHGDCHGQWLVYLTSGGDVEREDSVGVVHWRQLAAMCGIPRFDYVFAGGLDLDPAKAPELLEASCQLARRLAEAL